VAASLANQSVIRKRPHDAERIVDDAIGTTDFFLQHHFDSLDEGPRYLTDEVWAARRDTVCPLPHAAMLIGVKPSQFVKFCLHSKHNQLTPHCQPPTVMPALAPANPAETCWICGKSIPAIDLIVDEFGYPVHMACYPLRDSAKPKQVPPK